MELEVVLKHVKVKDLPVHLYLENLVDIGKELVKASVNRYLQHLTYLSLITVPV